MVGVADEIKGEVPVGLVVLKSGVKADRRLLVEELIGLVRNKVGQIFSINLDGTDAREFTRAEDGFPYGLSLSPDGRRVAYHLAAGSGYQVWTSDIQGGDRVRVEAQAGHIFFGPMWSPDGQWLAYQDCQPARDPGDDWSDIRISRPDGSEHRALTEGQSMWFGATYGDAKNHGGGSNIAAWTHDGAILFPRRLPGSKVPWEFQPHGGTEICRLSPHDGSVKQLTKSDPPVWDFRSSESPDGRQILFCRAPTGGSPAVWSMDADGRNARELTKGLNNRGAEHPRWLPQRG